MMENRTYKPWTEAELVVLRQMAIEPGTIKSKMDRVPGRGYSCVKQKLMVLGLCPARVSDLIADLMDDGMPRTVREIANAVDRTEKSVGNHLRDASANGPGQRYHVVDTAGERMTRRFVIGKGPNAVAAKVWVSRRAITAKESAADVEFRSKALWWPKADMTLVGAMNAMVGAGRAAV